VQIASTIKTAKSSSPKPIKGKLILDLESGYLSIRTVASSDEADLLAEFRDRFMFGDLMWMLSVMLEYEASAALKKLG
jgi:hypothetical protein